MTVGKRRRLRVLDFDIENRPLSYLGQDFTTGEPTAIAAGWSGVRSPVRVWVLGEDSLEEMLEGFRELYDEAGMVTGHYIRNHDLPVLNGAMLELGLPPLAPKLTSDTKNDLLKMRHFSKSQESLAEALGIPASKYHMSQPKWREANRLTPEGIELTKKRVVGDVKQHRHLRVKLAGLGYLGGPREWRP